MPKISHRLNAAMMALLCGTTLIASVAGSANPAVAAPLPTPTTAPTPTTTVKTPAGLADVKREGADAIAIREAQLTKLAGRLSAAPGCDNGGKIAAVVATDGPALQGLGTKLAGDTNMAEARADFSSIFDDYRIFLVVTPQAYATSACGRIQLAVTNLTTVESTLTARVQAAAGAGADMTHAEAALTDMASKLDEASKLAGKASTNLAAIVPDHGDKPVAEANWKVVQSARADLEGAHSSLTAAVKEARTVVADLKAAGKGH